MKKHALTKEEQEYIQLVKKTSRLPEETIREGIRMAEDVYHLKECATLLELALMHKEAISQN